MRIVIYLGYIYGAVIVERDAVDFKVVFAGD
jgi:hypothetical protein